MSSTREQREALSGAESASRATARRGESIPSAEERHSFNDELTTLNRERRSDDRSRWLTLVHDVSQAIDQCPNWNEFLRLVMRRICEAEDWQAGYVYAPAHDGSELVAAVAYSVDERFAAFHAASRERRYARGESLPGRVFDDGKHVWVSDPEAVIGLLPMRADVAERSGLRSVAAFPARIGHEILAVVELCSDRPHPDNEELLRLMRDLSTEVGRVIERARLMAQLGEAIRAERQDLIHTLHDSLGQQLTGLSMLAASLTRRLSSSDRETAKTAQHIAGAAQEALEHVRQLSKGLFPVDVDAGGFVNALRRLASNTETLHGIPCKVECDLPIAVSSDRVATQLFRIAQEAVVNALRHAQADHITIRLGAEASRTTMTIADGGVGIHNRTPKEGGIGLRIMRHRAASIGAALSVGQGLDGGTVVTCTLVAR